MQCIISSKNSQVSTIPYLFTHFTRVAGGEEMWALNNNYVYVI